MFALPALPQDLAIEPPSQPSLSAEVRTLLAPDVERAVGATTVAEYDAALEELIEHGDLPRVPIDLNRVVAAFGPANPIFIQSLGEFAKMRDALPYTEARDLRTSITMVQNTVFSGKMSLEWSRLIVEFIESSVGLAALFTALHHGAPTTRFFTRTLAERSLESTQALRLYLEAAARGEVSANAPASTASKLDDWTSKARAGGVHRPFGDHVE